MRGNDVVNKRQKLAEISQFCSDVVVIFKHIHISI